jgi:hypothetical protein
VTKAQISAGAVLETRELQTIHRERAHVPDRRRLVDPPISTIRGLPSVRPPSPYDCSATQRDSGGLDSGDRRVPHECGRAVARYAGGLPFASSPIQTNDSMPTSAWSPDAAPCSIRAPGWQYCEARFAAWARFSAGILSRHWIRRAGGLVCLPISLLRAMAACLPASTAPTHTTNGP